MKRSRPTPLVKYTALCDLVDTHKGRILNKHIFR